MGTSARTVTFVVAGQASQAAGSSAERGSVKAAVRVSAQRGSEPPLRVTARPGQDVVVLTIANGPTLVLHPENARDLLLAQQSGATRGAALGSRSSEIQVPRQLGWPGLETGATRDAARGWMGQAVLKSFEVITALAKDPAATLVQARVTAQVDGAVEEGVYALSADALAPLKGRGRKLSAVPASSDGAPMLVLVHGAFINTAETFGKLWERHSATVRDLFHAYSDRVYALEHATLGASPIANALALVRALPAGARLHLLAHSRGGYVAEVLARACAGNLPKDELAHFAGPGHSVHRSDLKALFKEARSKAIRVERIVRVACPIRGTLFASKRLDAYLSVLQWDLQLAATPVAPRLVDFLYEVARRRADPADLPGLEAMTPDSPVVAWLNGGAEPLPGELRVIAGDMEGDSIASWAKTLLADACYWTDNDLLVQTRSMYGGGARIAAAGGAGATFLLDRGGKVSHFNYFTNDLSVRAITSALVDDQPADFEAIGPLSWSGEDTSGTRAALHAAASRHAASPVEADPALAGQTDRPAVFVLPGMLGSNLKIDGRRAWLGSRTPAPFHRLAWDPSTAQRVEPDGPIGDVYGQLIERLAGTHEVIPFAFDWRRPIEDEARRLADAVAAALDARSTSQQPVRILAHSVGGLVARAMQLERPDTWQRMLARDGARLLMLGTPNGGTWTPMQVLSGDDTFSNVIGGVGSLFDGSARRSMAGMPGFIQWQAGLLDPSLRLDQAATWQKLADEDLAAIRDRSLWHLEGMQRAIYEWGAPSQSTLDQAKALRLRLDAQVETLASRADRIVMVVGQAAYTPTGFTLGAAGLEYLNIRGGGDGRTALAGALLPGVRTWQLDVAHGALASDERGFSAYVELLGTGQTGQLEPLDVAGAQRAQAAYDALLRNRPSRGEHSSRPPSRQREVFGVPAERALGPRPRPGGGALRIAVLNADLSFVRPALLIGHYRSSVLTGTEAVVDSLMGRTLGKSLALGLYPEATGTCHIFANQGSDPRNPLDIARPQAAVVVGLGEEGKLRAVDLVYSVRQAVLAYAQRMAERPEGGGAEFELAATLIGSGGAGISAGSAARLIAQGAYEANRQLRDSAWPQLGLLTLVELYLDRASEAWRALQVQAVAAPGRVEVTGTVRFGAGSLRRPLDLGYRGTAYEFFSAVTGPSWDGVPTIAYSLDTRRARTEVHVQLTLGTLVRELVAKASNDATRDAQIGRTLFDLLVPVDIEPFLGGTSELLIELDPGTAAIPWELLDTSAAAVAEGDVRPWAIRSKLLRKLRTQDFRSQVVDADADGSILVIGEPLVDPSLYPPMPGARSEAIAVAARLTGGPDSLVSADVRALASGTDDARAIINALFERPYRVLHVAGHGAPGASGGVVLSGATFLGPAEVLAMRSVPDLVFLNCCHLAASEVSMASYDRAEFAANIAESLIQIGVRCVVVAGWVVEDAPAEVFATSFYGVLLAGGRFMDAVAAGREAAWRTDPGGNTWGAYQCYGDPAWTWRRSFGPAQRPAPALEEMFQAVSSAADLALALETIAVRGRLGAASGELLRDRVRFLETKFAPQWGGMGVVAEAFAAAFEVTRDVDKAIEWYRVAVACDDGSASFRAAEGLGNQLSRRGAGSTNPAQAKRDIQEAIEHLGRLVALQTTTERQSLLGSAWKRLAMVEAGLGRDKASLDALARMQTHYGAAEALARASGSDIFHYPAKNSIVAELRLAFLKRVKPAISEERFDEVRRSIERAAEAYPDFWSVVGQIELRLLKALASGRLVAEQGDLQAAFELLKARVPDPAKWDAVYAEARFTLEPYRQIASGVEVQAADGLLDSLRAMAEPGGGDLR